MKKIFISILTILLAILLLPIFLLLFLLLFVPIFYRISITKDGEKIDTKIKVFGKELMQKKEKKDRTIKIFGKEIRFKKSTTKQEIKELEREEEQKKQVQNKKVERQDPDKEKQNEQQQDEDLQGDQFDDDTTTPPKKGLKAKIAGIKQSLTPISIYYGYYQAFRNYPDKQQIVGLTIDLLKKMFRAIKPRHFSLQGEVGIGTFETGMLLGTIFAIKPDLNISGNFTENVINGKIEIKGSLAFYKILAPIAAFLLKRPIRQLIKNGIKIIRR